jgi:valyl-tRNA synthetase
VHPDDERYHHLIGKKAVLPLVGRKIPIVADEYSDPEKGTGAVKITPAHDFNDFEVGRRHDLPLVNVLDREAKLNLENNEAFLAGLDPMAPDLVETLQMHGLDRFVARRLIVERMQAAGLVAKIEPHTHMVPHGDRSAVVIEPYLSDEWFVDAKTLAQPALAAVREGRTTFVPRQWETTYYNWLENIQPWNISRQLWWGHQIPAWYGWTLEGERLSATKKEIFVAETEEEALQRARNHYKRDAVLVETMEESLAMVGSGTLPDKTPVWRDPDVLDTWFSSALWPFSTLGWPYDTPELKRYYPTNVLSTGFDIIFFWVARMMMMGLHFMEDVPFRIVYIHALIRDQRGQKMSKSKGNVIDPLDLINDHGADALRFTMAAMAAQGRDVKVDPQRIEGYRNFTTKLWNAVRFAEMNNCVTVAGFDPRANKETLNRWIGHELEGATREITEAIEAFKFNEAAAAVYRFVWNIYCDWYVELAKPALTGPDGPAKDETRAMVAFVRDEILKLLHPFMPFITEELWRVTAEQGPPREGLLALSPWTAPRRLADQAADAEIGWVIDIVSAIRSVRAEMNLTVATELPVVLAGVSPETDARAGRWAEVIRRLARLSSLSVAPAVPPGSIQLVVRGDTVALPLKGVIDFAAEETRLGKELARVDADVARIDAKLNNPKFVQNAAEEVVEGEREKREEAQGRRAKIMEALERLKGAA